MTAIHLARSDDGEIAIEKIRTDGGTQSRAQLNEGRIEQYAEAMKAGAEFPVLRVIHDGSNYWLVDGFHRLEAAKRIGLKTVPVDVGQGTLDEAVWLSLAANKEHDAGGLYRSNADKRRAVLAALAHPEGQRRSDSGIARHVGVTQQFVSKIRGELRQNDAPRLTTVVSDGPGDDAKNADDTAGVAKRIDKNGREMKVGNIGKSRSEQRLRAAKPEQPSDADFAAGLEQLKAAESVARQRAADAPPPVAEPKRFSAPTMRDVPLDEPGPETITVSVVETLAEQHADPPSFAEVERVFFAMSRAHQRQLVTTWLRGAYGLDLDKVLEAHGFGK